MATDASNVIPRQRHVLATCENGANLQMISDLCAEAGLGVTRLIPGEALNLWICVRSLMSEDEGVARGVLQVRCQDASTRYELDRWLRAGGEHALVRAAGARVIKVKLVL